MYSTIEKQKKFIFYLNIRMEDSHKDPSQVSRFWYAVQTLYCKETRVASFFEAQGLTYFIPMRYEEQISLDGTRKRILVPAVHNLLFLAKTLNEKALLSLVKECPVPVFFVRHRDTKKLYEIRDREMTEFRAICDPHYEGTLYVDVATAEARPGQKVRVIRGPFTGLVGKLVRYKNRSYVVLTIATLGVMVHIPKWYCVKIE